MKAVVSGLPKSWHTAPSIIVRPRARDRGRRWPRRASSITISVCTQTSPSGCHSGSCGQPTSAAISGTSCVDHAELERQREPDGRPSAQQQQLLDLAPDALARQIVERRSPRHTRLRRLRPSPARTARRTAARAARAGCRRRRSARSTIRRTRALEIAPAAERVEVLARERIPRDGVDREVAPAAASSTDMRGSPVTSNPRWPRPIFDSRRGSATSTPADLVDRERLADRVDAAERLEQRAQRARPGGRKTSRSTSFDARPSSRSRTQPPTTSARPPASRTARAMASAGSGSGWTGSLIS